MAQPVVSNWSGFYLGGNVGLAINDSRFDISPSGCFLASGADNCGVGGTAANPNRSFSNHSGDIGFVGGAQFGYNWQLSPFVVAGFETDFNYNNTNAKLNETVALTGPLAGRSTTYNITQRLDWFGTVRARVGILPASDWLIYATGGLAFGSVSSSMDLAPVQCCSAESFGGYVNPTRRFGWTAGAGVEKQIAPNWTMKAEYLYFDLGSVGYANPCVTSRSDDSVICTGFASPPSFSSDVVTRQHILRVGINYQFGALQPPRPIQPSTDPSSKSRFYGGADYLLWRVKGAPLSVPLVSTGPISTTHHGWLTNTDATVLYGAPFPPAQGGNDTQSFPNFSGSKITLGYWLDDAKLFAVEAGGFFLQSRSAGFEANSGTDGRPIINIPVYNTTPYAPVGRNGGGPPNEDGLPASLPDDPARFDGDAGVFSGGVKITNTLRFWGVNGTGVVVLHRTAPWQVEALAGARYLNLSESLDLQYYSTGQTGVYIGQLGTAFDRFATRNQFYGALLGLRGRYTQGRWSAEFTGTAALGVNHQVLDVTGGYDVNNYIGFHRSGPEGVFAQPANEGTFSRNRFTVVPDLQAKLSYDLTPSIQISAGYEWIYLSSVVRPGDNINRYLPKGQTFQQGGDTVSTTSPARLFNGTDFYAHGLTLGLSARF